MKIKTHRLMTAMVALTGIAVLAADLEENKYLTYNEFVQFVEAGKIKQVRFMGKQMHFTGTLSDEGKECRFLCPGPVPPSEDPLLSRLLGKYHVTVVKEELAERPHRWKWAAATVWKMADGQTIKIGDEGGKIETTTGKVLERLKDLENVFQVIQSQNKQALLLQVMKRRPKSKSASPDAGEGYDYVALMVIRLKGGSGKSVLEASRVLSQEALTFSQADRWVSELGAVDEEGRRALIKVGEMHQKPGERKMDYTWQTWDLATEKKIGDGLSLPK